MKNLLAVLLLCSSALAAPQYTTVTATLIDSSAQVWANASWTTQFSKPAGNNGNFNNGGVPITANQFGVANASGVFTVVLDNNLAVSPSGSGWKFTICPNATVAQCNTIVLTIFGTTQDVSSQLNAVLTVPVVNTTQVIARAYNDTEVNASYGALYINSISNVLKQCIQISCNGSGWASFGVSSSNPIFTGTLTVPCVKFNFDLTNDSTLCSQPGTGHINLLLPATGGTLALAGSSTPGAPTNSVQTNSGTGFAGSSEFLFSNHLLSLNTSAWEDISGQGQLPPGGGDGTPVLFYIDENAATSYGAQLHAQGQATNTFAFINMQASTPYFQMGATSGGNYSEIDINPVTGIITPKAGPVAGAGLDFSASNIIKSMFLINATTIPHINFGTSASGDVAISHTVNSVNLPAGNLAITDGATATYAGLGVATLTVNGATSGSAPITASATGGTLNLGSTNATVTSGGALTVTSCTGCGGAGTGFPAQAGTEHSFKFDNSVTIDANNTNPGNLWSHLGGTFSVVSNVVSGNNPPNYRCITSGGTAGLTCSISEDAVAQQGSFGVFSGYSVYAAIQTGGQQIVWFAMSNQLYGNLANAAPNGTIFGFKYNGNASTHWFAYVSTSNVSLTATDTGIVADTNYHGFAFAKNGSGGIDYYIDNTKVATIASGATGFPGPTTPVYAVTTAGLLGASIDLGYNFNSIRWWTVF